MPEWIYIKTSPVTDPYGIAHLWALINIGFNKFKTIGNDFWFQSAEDAERFRQVWR